MHSNEEITNSNITGNNNKVYTSTFNNSGIKNNEVEFIFAVPEWAENEIPDSNKNLDISETVIGEYKFVPFSKDEVTYYERLRLNTKTGEFTVVN